MKTSDRRALRDAAEWLDYDAATMQRSYTRPNGTWPKNASEERLEHNEKKRLANRLRAIAEGE